MPRGTPAEARPRRGPRQPRHRPARPGEAGRGRRRISRGDRAQPDLPGFHYGLGSALSGQGKLDEAVAEYREAIRLKPDYAEAHCNLASILRGEGDYVGSLAMYRRGHELGSRQRGWRYPSAQWVATAERLAAMAARLPAVLRGEDRPKDVADRLALAQMCYDTKRFASAARFWAEALAADPKLGDDRRAGIRYNAACAAARAGTGQGTDDPKPDDAARAKLRGQALDWLKAERAAWAKVLDPGDARPARPSRRRCGIGRPISTSPASAIARPWRSSPRTSAAPGGPSGRRLTPC